MADKPRDRRAFRRMGGMLAAIIILVPSLPLTAAAQEPLPRRNLFDMLFGGPRYERYEQPRRYERNRRGDSVIEMAPRRERRGPARASAPRAAAPVTPPKPEPVAKLENARRILVVGDFFAGNLGGELDRTFEASPGVAVTTRSDGSSGLVRDDHYDWLAELPGILDEVKPNIVVVMLGANDRQQMTSGAREKFRTDEWFAEYQRRVSEVARMVSSSRKLPLLWVGLPSFQSPSMMADAVKMNAIYRSRAEEAGGEFVDIWEGFVDEDGKFIVTGSDVNGQQVRLRGSDGITFTNAGKEKLAFYVEKLARRHLGDMASPELANLDAGASPDTTLPGDASKALLAHPISLSDPELDGGKELLGALPEPEAGSQSPRDRLVKRGEMEPAPSGRIDNYKITATQ
jgi:uncharacterized protein